MTTAGKRQRAEPPRTPFLEKAEKPARRAAPAVPISPAELEANIMHVLTEGVGHGEKGFDAAVVTYVLEEAGKLLRSEDMLTKVPAPVNICGDIHGQLHDLQSLFKHGGMPPKSRYLFLGDYVDRGKHGVECAICLLGLKMLYPTHVYLLRGNHESAMLTKQYGFYDECKRRYSIAMWRKFCSTFQCLPVAGLVEKAVLCMHGGLSPELKSLKQIDMLPRSVDPPDSGLLCDLLWADPSPATKTWGSNERGVSYTFGERTVHSMLQELDLDLIVRAHQVVEGGYEFFAGRKLVTVFSATNYCGEFTNCGAMLKMGEDLRCSFHIFKPKFVKN